MLGTPVETIWPGVTLLQDFNSSFPQWDPPEDFADVLPDLKVRREQTDTVVKWGPKFNSKHRHTKLPLPPLI